MRAAQLGVGRWRVMLAVVFVATTVPFAFVHERLWGITGFVAFFGGLVLLRSRYSPTDEEERGELSVDGGALTFAGRNLELSAVKRVRIIPGSGHTDVELGRGVRSPYRFRVATIDDARAIVRALGYDATRRRDRFALQFRSEGSFGWGLASTFIAMVTARAGVPVAAMLFAAIIATTIIRRARFYLDVGPDGLFMRRLFGATRVAPTEIVGFRRGQSPGNSVELLIYRPRELPLNLWLTADNAAALEVKLAELRDGQAPADADADCARRLETHSVAELRALGRAPETFRVAGFDPVVLGRLVVDPNAAPRARARAAIALGTGEQLRIATTQTTIPELRTVFEHADSDDVEGPLAEVDRIVSS